MTFAAGVESVNGTPSLHDFFGSAAAHSRGRWLPFFREAILLLDEPLDDVADALLTLRCTLVSLGTKHLVGIVFASDMLGSGAGSAISSLGFATWGHSVYRISFNGG